MASTPKRGAKSGDDETLELSGVLVSGIEETPEYYANHAEASHSIHEYQLTFARIPARVTEEQKDVMREKGKFVAEALVRVSIPPTLIDDVIRILTIQKQKFAQTRNSIKPRNGSVQ